MAASTSDQPKEIADAFLEILMKNVPKDHFLATLDRSQVEGFVKGPKNDMDGIILHLMTGPLVIFAGTHDANDVGTDIGLTADASPLVLVSALGNALNTLLTETQFEAARSLLEDLAKKYRILHHL